MVEDFDTQLINDLDNVFLKEFSIDVIFKSSTSTNKVKVQCFEENLEKLDTSYIQVWGKYADFSYVRKNDTILISDVQYGVVDYNHDEFKSATILFIQKV